MDRRRLHLGLSQSQTTFMTWLQAAEEAAVMAMLMLMLMAATTATTATTTTTTVASCNINNSSIELRFASLASRQVVNVAYKHGVVNVATFVANTATASTATVSATCCCCNIARRSSSFACLFQWQHFFATRQE